MATEEMEDALTQEEIDALDETGEGSQGDEGDEDAAGLDDEPEEGGEGEEDGAQRQGGRQQDAGVLDKGRGSRRFQKLRNTLKEVTANAERTRQDYERRINDLEAAVRNGGRQQDQVSPELERARLEAMSPEERLEYKLDQSEKRHQQDLIRLQFENADRSDKQQFETRCVSDPRAKKYEAQVEQALAQTRGQGLNLKREVIYYYLLGQKVANAKASGAKQRQEGDGRVRQATTRPSKSGSDTGGTRGGKTLAQRLEGVSI